MTMEPNDNDFVLLNMLRQGDRKAFDTLFRRYYPMLCAYLNRLVAAPDAEEIVQETMIWLWEHRERLVIETSLCRYLFKMVYHRTLNLLARQEVARRAEHRFFSRYQEMPESINHYQITELTKRIEEVIAQLPDAYREAFVLHRFKGMSYKEIAEVACVSPKTIDYRMQQALKLLRISLKDYLPVLGYLL